VVGDRWSLLIVRDLLRKPQRFTDLLHYSNNITPKWLTLRLRSAVKELWVIERRPQEGDFTEADSDRFLPQADVIGITGTTFTNHSLEGLLRLCNPRAYVVIPGDTTPLSPMLFDYGVSAISGTKVIEPKTVLRYVSQGATFRQIKGIRRLTMMR